MGELWRRWRCLLSRDRLARELEEEMQFHLQMKAQQNRDAGMRAEEAGYAARRQFGNATLLAESSRGAWGWRWPEALAQDCRFAGRLMPTRK